MGLTRWCPSCAGEFQLWVVQRPDCLVQVVQEPPATPGGPPAEVQLERVYAGNDHLAAHVAVEACRADGLKVELLTFDESGVAPEFGTASGFWLLAIVDERLLGSSLFRWAMSRPGSRRDRRGPPGVRSLISGTRHVASAVNDASRRSWPR